jgi:predicted molibdopterin-dependent oxidoreductase YjgC
LSREHQHPQLVYDPRKCILCGICVQLSEQAAEPLGLAILGRGFESRVDVPLDASLAEAVRTAAPRLAGACPTGALTLRPSAARTDDTGLPHA